MAIFRDDNTGEIHVHIHGLVDEMGYKQGGEEFSSERITTGVYRVQFDRPFGELPSVVCTAWQPRDAHMSVTLAHIAEDHFECRVTHEPNEPEDSGFSFIAFGREM